jgi:tetratricopeptide (TPR) repeat protein
LSDSLHPPAERLAEYVEGLLSSAEKEGVDRHLAACAACREVVAETVALIAPASVEPRGDSRLLPFRSRIAGAVLGIGLSAAAALALFFVPAGLWREQPPFEVLNAAYSARRSIELRFPHAAFGPMRVTRGAPLTDQSPAVLEALSSIRRQLEKPNRDASWYHADGVASLLMRDYDEAIRSLERAADAGEASPDLSIHMAVAYFERAEANDAPQDYTKAVELLTQALQREPGNATALFNRGIILSRLKRFDAAIQDFDGALKVEPDKQWADEARSRLAAAREAQGR